MGSFICIDIKALKALKMIKNALKRFWNQFPILIIKILFCMNIICAHAFI